MVAGRSTLWGRERTAGLPNKTYDVRSQEVDSKAWTPTIEKKKRHHIRQNQVDMSTNKMGGLTKCITVPRQQNGAVQKEIRPLSSGFGRNALGC